MKKCCLIIMLCYSYVLTAQQHDAQWIVGTGAASVDFRQPETVTTYNIGGDITFVLTVANICDEEGNLLYMSNGVIIADKNGDTLENGGGINPDPFTSQHSYGLNVPQAAIFLPKPGSSRYYYLFHYTMDAQNNTRPKKFYYSLVDKQGNGGLGTVVEKNVIISNGLIMRGGGMTACKHANGRDWWLITGVFAGNNYMKFLITPDSIQGPFYQQIGWQYQPPLDVCYSQFSVDGSKYATGCYEGEITVMDFDRCTGEFSNAVLVYNNGSGDPINSPLSGCTGLAISPSNRFLYTTIRLEIDQYDLWSANIQDSAVIYKTDSTDFFQSSYVQTAPNGTIYVCGWNGGQYALHVINKPDELGDSCNFVYGGQAVSNSGTYNLPNIPNYRLGPLIGSGCDTLPPVGIKDIDKQSLLNIQPNPANAYVYVEVGKPSMYSITLYDIAGRPLQQAQSPQVTIFNTEHLANGTYFISVTDSRTNKLIESRQIIVQH